MKGGATGMEKEKINGNGEDTKDDSEDTEESNGEDTSTDDETQSEEGEESTTE